MNREIEFRGKSIESGEWLYGSHFTDSGEDYIIPQNLLGIKDYEVYQADQNTIGQFTGVTDKNGVKIFEGDIVRYDDTLDCDYVRYDEKQEVEFIDGSFYPVSEYWCQGIMVIGNIYDNQEPLNKK